MRDIRSTEDLYTVLDGMFDRMPGEWWDQFYGDRGKPVPFFRDAPDEGLVE